MTLYNIEKLEALKLKYTSSIVGGELSNRGVMNKGLIITDFIEYLREIEKDSSFDPNQIEIPFKDEDNSK
jgi:hypothetical protein